MCNYFFPVVLEIDSLAWTLPSKMNQVKGTSQPLWQQADLLGPDTLGKRWAAPQPQGRSELCDQAIQTASQVWARYAHGHLWMLTHTF